VEWSAISSGKPEYPNMFRYYRAQLADAGVELRLHTEVTPALVNQENPDLVVIATGAAPFSPPIDAENLPNVVQAWDVLRHDAKTGTNVVVVGGGSVGLETAIYLAAKGTISQEQVYFLTLHKAEDPEILWDLMTKGTKNVTVLEMAGRVGQDLGLSTRWVVMKDLTARGVQTITKATMKDIRPGEVAYTDGDGREQVIPADTVVLAMGARPENSLVEQLKPTGVPLEVIGDAAKVGRIGDAVEQGFRLACEV
jgi:2,4-dienoyl-CoA reductase (NADPH2)